MCQTFRLSIVVTEKMHQTGCHLPLFPLYVNVVCFLLDFIVAVAYLLPAVCRTNLLSVLVLVLFYMTNQTLKYCVDQTFKFDSTTILANDKFVRPRSSGQSFLSPDDTFNTVGEEQAGFRAGRSTTEQIFNLRILCNKYLQHQ